METPEEPVFSISASGCAIPEIAKKRIGIAILSYNRPDALKTLLDSICLDTVQWIHVLVDGGGGVEYDFYHGVDRNSHGDSIWLDEEHLTVLDQNHGVSRCKNRLMKMALDAGVENLYLMEDDVEVLDNSVWEMGVEWSIETGIRHWNWNNYRYGTRNNRCFGEEYKIAENTEASFSFFTSDMMLKFPFDENFYNAFEHVDQELRMSMRGYIPPFWGFVQPVLLDTMLGCQEVETGIHQPTIISGASAHWKNKYGYPIALIEKPSWRSVRNSLTSIRKRFGTPYINTGIRRMGIASTIRNRMVLSYTNSEQLTVDERRMSSAYDEKIKPLSGHYATEPNFKLNQSKVLSPKFVLRNFLESFRRWTDDLEGIETVLCITDWNSSDGIVEELISDMWDGGRFGKIRSETTGKEFSRGFGLNNAAKLLEDTDFLFFTDVDCVLTGNEIFEHGNIVTRQKGALFPIALREMTPNSIFHYTEWGTTGQCFVSRDTFDNTGGFPEYWSWGGEGDEYRKRLYESGTCVIVESYPELIHSWHSDTRRHVK